MKKLLLFLILVLLAFSLVACGGETPETPDTPEIPGGETPDTPEEPDEPSCEHEFVEIARTEARALQDGVIISKCNLCNEEKTEVHTPMTRELKILAIGNSFSNDATGYLWDICHSAGVEKLIIGHAYVGGCPIDLHGSYILNKNAVYKYYKYEKSSTPTVKDNVKIDVALLDEDWDYISLQTLSEYTTPAKFSLLTHILDYLDNKCPDAEIYWHMTWSFREDCQYNGFALHNYDQMALYNAILNVVSDIITPTGRFDGIIPTGTSMQNLRTSYIGDNVTREDGYHADLGVGRYTLGLTWYAIFTGGSLDLVDFIPTNEHKTAIANNMEVMRESVENALAKPYEITQSKFTEAPAGK